MACSYERKGKLLIARIADNTIIPEIKTQLIIPEIIIDGPDLSYGPRRCHTCDANGPTHPYYHDFGVCALCAPYCTFFHIKTPQWRSFDSLDNIVKCAGKWGVRTPTGVITPVPCTSPPAWLKLAHAESRRRKLGLPLSETTALRDAVLEESKVRMAAIHQKISIDTSKLGNPMCVGPGKPTPQYPKCAGPKCWCYDCAMDSTDDLDDHSIHGSVEHAILAELYAQEQLYSYAMLDVPRLSGL